MPDAAQTVELREAGFYWIRRAHAGGAEEWTVARWEHGCWWGAHGRETTPRAISGPIPEPAAK